MVGQLAGWIMEVWYQLHQSVENKLNHFEIKYTLIMLLKNVLALCNTFFGETELKVPSCSRPSRHTLRG